VNQRAVTIDRPGALRVEAVAPASPGPGEALIRVAYSGICGSDREVFTGGRPAGLVTYPVVPGHEWSGTVTAVGSDVDTGLVGQRVVAEGFRGCQRCSSCRRGENNLCESGYDETGFTRPGAWSDELVVPARLLHVLPADADLRSAAALEPSACVAEACLRLGSVSGERVAVVGGGSIGLLGTQLLAAMAPAEVVVVEPSSARAELAVECGATTVITPREALQRIGRFDTVLEAAGARGTADLAARLARRGGRLALTGVPGDAEDAIPTVHLVATQLTVHTVFGAPSRAWTHAVRMFGIGRLDPGLIVTHEYALDDAQSALDTLESGRDDVVKILLKP